MCGKFSYKIVVVLAVVALTGMNLSAYAAGDGTLGSTSTGTTDITLIIPNLIQVSDLNDMDLGTWDGSSVAGDSDTVCVYSNTGGNYTATFSGSGAGAAFTINNGLATILYAVTYDDGAGADPITSGTGLTCANANQASYTCGGTNNGTIAVSILATNMALMAANTYSGTLTMLVAPL